MTATVSATIAALLATATAAEAREAIGISSDWLIATTYVAGAYATGSDGNIYRAIATTAGDDPTTDDGSNWSLFHVVESVTLNIPSRFSLFDDAWAFLAGAEIAPDALVTIQFADGTHGMGGTRKLLNHRCGALIRIIGNETTPASCILDFSDCTSPGTGYIQPDWGCLTVSNGNVLGYLSGFKVQGPGVAVEQLNGILAINGAKIIGADDTGSATMWVTDFALPVTAYSGSTIYMPRVRASNGGDGCIFAYAGSRIDAPYCIAEGASYWFAMSGLLAEHGSVIFAPGAILRENTKSQAACQYGASLMLNGATLSVTGALIGTSLGVRMQLADNCDLDNVTYTNVPTPTARIANFDTPDIQKTFFGHIVTGYSLDGRFVFATENAFKDHVVIAQQNLVEAFIGHQASSTLLQITNSGTQTEVRCGTDDHLGLNGTRAFLFSTLGNTQIAPTSALADATLGNGSIHFYLDEGANNLKVKAKYSGGTVKTATIALV